MKSYILALTLHLMLLVAGGANVEVTSSKSTPTATVTTPNVSTLADDEQDPAEDEQKIIHDLLSRLEAPEVSCLLA